jgi:uncharacterized protein YcnI
MKRNLLAAASAAALVLTMPVAASAHVNIIPGVSATGSSTQAITAGQSGTLYFRIGHGCTFAYNLNNPATNTSFQGSKWGTSAVSIDIPPVAQGTGSTLPKPQWIPGWTSKVVKNATTGVYTVTWTAKSPDFWIADGPEGDTGATQFADFGVNVKWATSAAGQTVYFKTVQTCPVRIPAVPATKKTKAVPAKTVYIYNSWDVTDGSGADGTLDDTEHNTAPSVKVLG